MHLEHENLQECKSFGFCIPDYLVIGHVAKDNIPDGAMLGGTCAYSALTARNLKQQVALVTCAGTDIPSLDILQGVQVKCIPYEYSTTFENIYRDGQRYQKWLAQSGIIELTDIPDTWQHAPIVHLAPIAQEISPRLCVAFPNSLVCVTVQGWLRGYDSTRNVIYEVHPELNQYLPYIDILVTSLADFQGDKTTMTRLLTSVKVGIETLGEKGCRVYQNEHIFEIPTQPEKEADSTGAGDIFSTTFFVYYHKTKDIVKSAQYANVCALLSVRNVGMKSIPTLPEIETHLAEHFTDWRSYSV